MTPVPFTTEIFNPSTPVEVPVRGFTYGQRLRVVLQPIDKKDKKLHVKEELSEDSVSGCQRLPRGGRSTINVYWVVEVRTRFRRIRFIFADQFKRPAPVALWSDIMFLVHVNGHHLYEFRERQSGWAVSSIEVGGDVHVHSVHIG
ncbi:galactoside-binding lectin, partial [Ostertagia ostertagi]